MTTEPTNADRAAWAKAALTIFTARTYGGDHPDTMDRGDLDTAISDLIADLLHYAWQQEFDVPTLFRHAWDTFEIELFEETRP